MKIVVLFVLLVIPNVSFAVTYISNVKIKEVIVNVNSGVHFRLTSSMANNENCNSNTWFKIPSDLKYEEAAISLILSREAQDRNIWLKLAGCESGYPKIDWIR